MGGKSVHCEGQNAALYWVLLLKPITTTLLGPLTDNNTETAAYASKPEMRNRAMHMLSGMRLGQCRRASMHGRMGLRFAHLLWLEEVHIVDGVPPDVGHHVQEQVVPLQLVLNQRVPLRIASQTNRLHI